MSPASDVVGQRNLKDVFAGAVVAVVGGALLLQALSFENTVTQSDPLGPGLFPTIASSILLGGGLLLVLAGLHRRDGSAQPGIAGEALADEHEIAREVMTEEKVPLGRLGVVLGIFVAHLIALVPVGFILSTTLFMTAMTTFVAPDRLRRNVAVGAGLAVSVYLAFTGLLGVELPAGILG